MKVLEEGREQTGWAKEFRCTGAGNGDGGCGALLLVEQADVFSTESHSRDETTTYRTFQCPECRVMTDIKESLPFSIPTKVEWVKRQAMLSESCDG